MCIKNQRKIGFLYLRKGSLLPWFKYLTVLSKWELWQKNCMSMMRINKIYHLIILCVFYFIILPAVLKPSLRFDNKHNNQSIILVMHKDIVHYSMLKLPCRSLFSLDIPVVFLHYNNTQFLMTIIYLYKNGSYSLIVHKTAIH